MHLFKWMLAVLLLISGCSATRIKTSEPLPYKLAAYDYDGKSKKHVPAKITVKNMLDTDGIEYFWILSGNKEEPEVALSQRYIDEYLFFIEKFITQYPSESKEVVNLGTSHTVKKARLNFSSIYSNGLNYLSLNNCMLGKCGKPEKGVLVFDKENVILLKNYLIDYLSSKPNTTYAPFKPPAINNSEYARVYLYRLHSPPLAIDYPIQINGRAVGAIAESYALPVLIKKGKHEIRVLGSKWTGVPELSNSFEFEPGKNYFIKYSQTAQGDFAIGVMMNLDIDQEAVKQEFSVVAQHDLVNCKIAAEIKVD